MDNLMAHARLLFTFSFSDFFLPYNIKECEKLRSELKKVKGGEESVIELHHGENWEDGPFTRKFLLTLNPHLHYKKAIKKEVFPLLEKDWLTKYSEISLNISIVQGGSGGAELKIDNLQISDFEALNTSFLRSVTSFQDFESDKLFFLNKFFIKEIYEFLNILKNVNYFNSTAWNEFSEKEADYVVVVKKTKNGYDYGTISSGDGDNCSYQQPYLVLFIPYPQESGKRVRSITDYFGGAPLLISECFFKKGANKEFSEGTLTEEGIRKLVIGNEDEHTHEIYMDPTKILVFTKEIEKQSIKEIGFIIHRALFLARTIMHYCILWDSKLQVLFQQIHKVLQDIDKCKDEPTKLFDHLEQVNNISLKLSSGVAELFDSFVWRYATFLPSRLGYLSTIYKLMDSLMEISAKTKNIRESVNELRRQVEFAASIIREKIAEKLPKLLKEDISEEK